MSAQVGVYRPRRPENTSFYRCQDDYWEEFQRGYEVLFEKVYGPLRPAVTRAVVLAEMYEAAFPDEDVMGAAVIAIQTAGDQVQGHLHALVPDAVWTRHGRRLNISYLDPDAMTHLFQARVLRMLVDEHRLSGEFAARLRAWRHSGFQVYRGQSVEPHDAPTLERLCAYIARAVFASTRVEYDPSTGAVTYRTAQGADLGLDALEWMALVTQHIPNRGEHTRHDFGYYSNAARGKRKKLAARAAAQPGQPTGDSTDTAEAARWPPASRRMQTRTATTSAGNVDERGRA